MLHRFLPGTEDLRHSRLLRWMGPRLHDPVLWRLERGAAARGIAIGAFFGLMIPVVQIPAAAVAALLLRANLWLAVCATLISNPLTYAPLYYLAWRLGLHLLGAEPGALPVSDEGWLQRLLDAGAPLLAGMLVMGLAAGLCGYLLTHLFWGLHQRLWPRPAPRTE